MNRWNLIGIYAAVVCVLSAIALFFGILFLAQYGVQLTIPSFLEADAPNLYINYYEDNAAYRQYRCPPYNDEGQKRECPLTGKSEEQITALREHDREKKHAEELNTEKRRVYQSLVDSLLALLISAIFFIIHWRILHRALRTPLQSAEMKP